MPERDDTHDPDDAEAGTDDTEAGGDEAVRGSVDGADASDVDDAIEALARAYALKDETRTGWQLRGVEGPESVAAHAWGVAAIVLRFCPPELDRERALVLAVVHDVAEAETGDYPTRADAGAASIDPDEKSRLERGALEGPLAALGPSFRDAWAEYEARDSPEARFVKDADLLDTCLQALVYERGGRYDPEADDEHFEEYDDLDEFFATTEPRLSTDAGRALYERIRDAYRDAKD